VRESEVRGAGTGGDDSRLAAISALVYQRQKLLGGCLEQISGWSWENGVVTFCFPPAASFAADLVKNREQQEILREAVAQVLGQSARICVKLESMGVGAPRERPGARQRAERDSGIEAFRRKFDGVVLEVRDLSGE